MQQTSIRTLYNEHEEEDEKNQELNLIIKTLGKRGKESVQWKTADQDFWKTSLKLFSEILSNASSEGSITLRPYGSAVEDLKSEEADDLGDVDIMTGCPSQYF